MPTVANLGKLQAVASRMKVNDTLWLRHSMERGCVWSNAEADRAAQPQGIEGSTRKIEMLAVK
jgi:hypothetical protein